MFLTSEAGNFLIIAIIAVFVIALALVIYLLLTTKKEPKENNKSSFAQSNNYPNVVQNNIEGTIDNQNNFEETIPNNIEETVDNHIVNNEAFNNFNLIEEAEKRIDDISLEENNIQEFNQSEIPNYVDDNSTIDSTKKEEEEETNIESVLKEMQKDLDSLEKNEAEIARYEEEEEKNAIISYKELMKYKDAQEKNLDENAQDKDIVLEDKDKAEIKKVIENTPATVKKFKRSEFISPIFGYNDDSKVTYREIKRPPRKEKAVDSKLEWESDRILKDLEDSSAEVMEFEEKKDNVDDNTTKFLDELVDFRKKLD